MFAQHPPSPRAAIADKAAPAGETAAAAESKAPAKSAPLVAATPEMKTDMHWSSTLEMDANGDKTLMITNHNPTDALTHVQISPNLMTDKALIRFRLNETVIVALKKVEPDLNKRGIAIFGDSIDYYGNLRDLHFNPELNDPHGLITSQLAYFINLLNLRLYSLKSDDDREAMKSLSATKARLNEIPDKNLGQGVKDFIAQLPEPSYRYGYGY